MKSDNALRSPGLARAFGFATALIWGLSFLSIKVAIAAIPPMTLGLLRFVIAAALLPLLALATRESLRVEPRDLPRLASGGLLGVTLYFLCENNGVKLLSASEASLIVGVIPVVTMLAERAFLGTRVGFRSYLGALLSFAGVGLIAARSAGASSSPLGFLYMGGAALCWVAYSFVTAPSRRATARSPSPSGRASSACWASSPSPSPSGRASPGFRPRLSSTSSTSASSARPWATGSTW